MALAALVAAGRPPPARNGFTAARSDLDRDRVTAPDRDRHPADAIAIGSRPKGPGAKARPSRHRQTEMPKAIGLAHAKLAQRTATTRAGIPLSRRSNVIGRAGRAHSWCE